MFCACVGSEDEEEEDDDDKPDGEGTEGKNRRMHELSFMQ